MILGDITVPDVVVKTSIVRLAFRQPFFWALMASIFWRSVTFSFNARFVMPLHHVQFVAISRFVKCARGGKVFFAFSNMCDTSLVLFGFSVRGISKKRNSFAVIKERNFSLSSSTYNGLKWCASSSSRHNWGILNATRSSSWCKSCDIQV